MITTTDKTNTPTLSLSGGPRLTVTEFQQLAKLVYAKCGINLVDAKKTMLESRLTKRLRETGMPTFREYMDYLDTPNGMENELIHMIDVVTTNKTDFYREPHHFEYLIKMLLPRFQADTKNRRSFRIWSAACSTGEEPYTLAMILEDYARENMGFNYNISASDISTRALQKAALAVYNPEHVKVIPLAVRQRYLLKSKNTEKPSVRVVSALRDKVQFKHINLMHNVLNIDDDLDTIFCRNVLIYFDRKTQLEVVRKLVQKLRPGGHLFIGHSESLHQFDLPIRQVKPTVFVKV